MATEPKHEDRAQAHAEQRQAQEDRAQAQRAQAGTGPSGQAAERQHAEQERARAAGQQAAGTGPTRDQKDAADDARAAASIGAQIILDFNGDAALGARGGAADTVEENIAIRDADLIALGLNPVSPSGPPGTWAPPAPPAEPASAKAASGSGTATRMSSLAAGIITTPPARPDSETRAQAHAERK